VPGSARDAARDAKVAGVLDELLAIDFGKGLPCLANPPASDQIGSPPLKRVRGRAIWPCPPVDRGRFRQVTLRV
jgi:hypothetical protein